MVTNTVVPIAVFVEFVIKSDECVWHLGINQPIASFPIGNRERWLLVGVVLLDRSPLWGRSTSLPSGSQIERMAVRDETLEVAELGQMHVGEHVQVRHAVVDLELLQIEDQALC